MIGISFALTLTFQPSLLRFPASKGSFAGPTCAWDLRLYHLRPMGPDTQILPSIGLGNRNIRIIEFFQADTTGIELELLPRLNSAMPSRPYRSLKFSRMFIAYSQNNYNFLPLFQAEDNISPAYYVQRRNPLNKLKATSI